MAARSTQLLLVAVAVATLAVVPLARAFFGSVNGLLGEAAESPEHRRLLLGDLVRLLAGLMPKGEIVPKLLWLVLVWVALVALVYGLLSLLV